MGYKRSSYILQTLNEDGDLILKNTLTQKIFKVKSLDVQLLKNALDCNYDTIHPDDEIANILYQNGFIVNDYVDESQIVDYLFNKEVYGNGRLELTIIPTNACNFDCIYCYQKEPYFYMSEKTMKSIVLYIERNLDNYSGLLISWFGGEPLLAKELIISMMHEVRKICLAKRKPFYSNMTTNGYELDPLSFKQLVQNHVRYFQITIDGPECIHNQQRPHKTKNDSFEKITSNLMFIKNTLQRYSFKIAIRINISSKVQPYLDEFVNWLYSNFGNDPRFTIIWESVRDWGGDKIEQNKDFLFAHAATVKWMDVLNKMGFAINMGLEKNDITVTLCIASKVNGYVINYDGKVYKCAMVLEEEDFRDINNIGQILENGSMDLNIGKMVQWIGKSETKEKCNCCCHFPECMGISCPLGVRILRQENRCNELFIDDYEYLLRNRDIVKDIPYLR